MLLVPLDQNSLNVHNSPEVASYIDISAIAIPYVHVTTTYLLFPTEILVAIMLKIMLKLCICLTLMNISFFVASNIRY